MSDGSRFLHFPHVQFRAVCSLTAATVLLLVAGLAACGSRGSAEPSGSGASMDASSPAPHATPVSPAAAEIRQSQSLSDPRDATGALGMIGGQAIQARAGAPPVQPGSADLSLGLDPNVASAVATPSMVMRSGHASVEVDTLARAIASIQRITASLGGYVGNTDIALGEDQIRRATIELKIPVSRYDDAVSGLGPLGTVESVNSSAEDVGAEFTDLTARITNAHRLESRLIALLAERTGKLQDALMLERELARVREEIERYQGRIRFLGARVAMSTLTVNLHEPIPLVSRNPSEGVLVAAAKDAWRNFVTLLALAIASLGVLLPVGAVGAAVYALHRRRAAGQPARTVAVPATGA